MKMKRGADRRVGVLIGLLTFAIVVRVALPQIVELWVQARAEAIRDEVEAVRQAAQRFNDDRGRWPADAGLGETPSDLAPFLPTDFSFQGDGYRLDWEHWTLPAGLPTDPTVTTLVGISITTNRTAVALAAIGMLGDGATFRLGDTFTFLFSAN